MTDFIGLVSLLRNAAKDIFEYRDKNVLKFSVNTDLSRELYDCEYAPDFFPIEIEVYPVKKATHVRVVEISDCTLCEDVYDPGDCGGIGVMRFRPKTEEPHENRITINERIPAGSGLTLVVWVRPAVGAESIKVCLEVDGWLQPQAYVIPLY